MNDRYIHSDAAPVGKIQESRVQFLVQFYISMFLKGKSCEQFLIR